MARVQRRAGLVGTGLIGGSIGMALRRAGWHVTGTDADDALYTNPFGNKVADDTVALTITKAF